MKKGKNYSTKLLTTHDDLEMLMEALATKLRTEEAHEQKSAGLRRFDTSLIREITNKKYMNPYLMIS